MGAYGVTAELGEQLDAARNVATGGTLFGNPLSAAAAKAALSEVLLPAAYAHTAGLGGELADAISSAGLPWTVIRLGPRSGQWYGHMPRTGAQAHAITDDQLTRLIRIWLANRGYGKHCPARAPPSRSPPPAPTWPATSRPTTTCWPSYASPAPPPRYRRPPASPHLLHHRPAGTRSRSPRDQVDPVAVRASHPSRGVAHHAWWPCGPRDRTAAG
jgi:hypothetical protein